MNFRSLLILAAPANAWRGLRRTVLGTIAGFLTAAAAADWPQFLGPNRNGSTTEFRLSGPWPKDGPRTAWQTKAGAGFAGPVVAAGKVILFHRIEDRETIECLEAGSGKALWKSGYPTSYQDDFGFDEGPRGTPAISGGRVFTFGAEGMLHGWDLADGRKLWSVDTKKEFAQRKGFFGMACSPLVEDGRVVVNVGGRAGAGLVAFDAETGRTLWKCTDDEASYASPVAATVSGKRRILAITREALVMVDPADGDLDFRYPWRPSMDASVSAASPIVVEDMVFLSASYGTGATLLRIAGNKPEKIWSADDVLSNHYATSVYRDGFLYGFDGRQEQGCDLRCVEFKTGKVRWSQGGLGAGTVTLVHDQLLILTDKGGLIQAAASPEGYNVANRAQVLPFGTRAHPAAAGGRFFARSKDKLVAIELTQPKP